MTSEPRTRRPVRDDAGSGRAVVVPDKPALEGLEATWSQRWKADDTYAFDRSRTRERGLLDRHAAARPCRGVAARRARLLLHPHRPDRAVPADARARGVLPDGLGRQRPADRAPGAELLRRALRPVAALRRRLHAAGEAGREDAGPDQPARTSSSCASGSSRRTRRSSSRCGARSASRSTGSSTTRRSARSRRPRRSAPSCATSPAARPTSRSRRRCGTSPSRPRSRRPSSRPASTPAPTTGSRSTGRDGTRSTSRPPGPS